MKTVENGGVDAKGADSGRDGRGRFSTGATPGPGRPRKPTPEAVAVGPATDGPELIVRGMLLMDLDEAWRHVIVAFRPRVVYRLACEALAHGDDVPDVVLDFLDGEGLALKPAKHRALGEG